MNSLVRTIKLSELPGRTGRGIRIAVIDSGIHPNHPHIGSVEGGVAFDDAGTLHADVVDRIGHGTAVAAAIHEKSPDAVLIPVKVFDRRLTTTGRALAAAIRWAVAQKVAIVNLSLGTTNPEHRQLLADVVAEARNAGMVIVAAAPTEDHAWLPGGLPGVIGVELDWSCPRESCQVLTNDAGVVRVRASGFPRPIPGVPPDQNLKGQSFAVANATGLIALTMGSDPGLTLV
jgi:Subtilase family